MAILYTRPKYQSGGSTENLTQQKMFDQGVSRQSGKAVFVGEGAEAPITETPKRNQIYDYKKVGVQGGKDYISIDDLKTNPAYNPNRTNPVDISSYTDADYIKDAQTRLQQRRGDNWRYIQVGNRLYTQQAQPTNYYRNEYSTGQYFITDDKGNVVEPSQYPSYIDYNKNLVVSGNILPNTKNVNPKATGNLLDTK